MRNKNLLLFFRKSVKPADILILLLCLGLILLLSLKIYTARNGTELVEIKMKDEVWVYPLNTDKTINLETDSGPILIEISQGSVRVTESPCKEKICIRSGSVSKPGQWIACLPSNVLITVISAKDKDGPDETAY